MSSHSFSDSTRLDDRTRERLFEELDGAATEQREVVQQRRHARLPFRLKRIFAVIVHPTGKPARQAIVPRNISSGGLGFIHGQYLHAGTVCHLAMERRDGTREIVEGVVVNCRYLHGGLHEIGLRFTKAIDLREFLPDAPEEAMRELPVETPPTKQELKEAAEKADLLAVAQSLVGEAETLLETIRKDLGEQARADLDKLCTTIHGLATKAGQDELAKAAKGLREAMAAEGSDPEKIANQLGMVITGLGALGGGGEAAAGDGAGDGAGAAAA